MQRNRFLAKVPRALGKALHWGLTQKLKLTVKLFLRKTAFQSREAECVKTGLVPGPKEAANIQPSLSVPMLMNWPCSCSESSKWTRCSRTSLLVACSLLFPGNILLQDAPFQKPIMLTVSPSPRENWRAGALALAETPMMAYADRPAHEPIGGCHFSQLLEKDHFHRGAEPVLSSVGGQQEGWGFMLSFEMIPYAVRFEDYYMGYSLQMTRAQGVLLHLHSTTLSAFLFECSSSSFNHFITQFLTLLHSA